MNIKVNGIELYYEVMGSGKPLIMVHGNGEDHTIFLEAAQKLQQHFTCYLIDSRGHGKSQHVDSFDYTVMAQDMKAFIEELKLEDVRFYGFSDGGIIGLILAQDCPQVSELIVSGANTNPQGVVHWMSVLLKVMYFFKKDPKIHLMMSQPHILPSELGKITARTLVLAGSKDLIQEEHTKQFASYIQGSTLRILEGENHGSYIIHKEGLADILLDFFTE